MPSNLAAAVPVGVFPKMTFVSFDESRVYPVLSVGYHDATVDRMVLWDTANDPRSIRSYAISARLTAAALLAFVAFFESHAGGVPFYFYHFREQTPGAREGSNWHADGLDTQGRHVCIFESTGWSKTFEVGQRSTMSCTLREVA